MGEEQKERIAEALQEASKDGRIACRQALEVAERLGADSRQVGRMADELKIKIKACQLGCF